MSFTRLYNLKYLFLFSNNNQLFAHSHIVSSIQSNYMVATIKQTEMKKKDERSTSEDQKITRN